MNSGSTGKNQDTAYDYMKARGDSAFNEYVEFIKSYLNKKDGISKSKFNKLMMSADKIPDDFITSQPKIEVNIDCLHHMAFDYVVKNEIAFIQLRS